MSHESALIMANRHTHTRASARQREQRFSIVYHVFVSHDVSNSRQKKTCCALWNVSMSRCITLSGQFDTNLVPNRFRFCSILFQEDCAVHFMGDSSQKQKKKITKIQNQIALKRIMYFLLAEVFDSSLLLIFLLMNSGASKIARHSLWLMMVWLVLRCVWHTNGHCVIDVSISWYVFTASGGSFAKTKINQLGYFWSAVRTSNAESCNMCKLSFGSELVSIASKFSIGNIPL